MGEVIPAKKMRDKIAGANVANPPPANEDDRPEIVYVPGEISRVCDEGEAAILAMSLPPRAYQRGGTLVHIVRRGPTNARKIKKHAGSIGIVPMDVPALVEILTLAAVWLREDKRNGGYRKINAPHEVATMLLSRCQWRLYPLTGVLESPTLRPDGSILFLPGYDTRTGLFLDLGDATFPSIAERPERTTALAGLNVLRDALKEFAFATAVDESIAVCAILTALLRLSLGAAPLFGISAQVMGSGKTYLAHTISLIATGREAPVMTPSREPKEEAKAIFAALLSGDLILLLDNVEHQLSSDTLCAALTSEILRDRVLGASRVMEASTACLFMVTGNNLQIAGDLSARALICRLHPQCEHPEHRRFERNLSHWIREQRGQLVAGALTFLRGFLSSGEKPDIEPWQRFPEWDALIRSALVWAGLPDPLDALRAGERADPRRIEHEAVMAVWNSEFADKAVAARDIVSRAQDMALTGDHALKDALLNVAGEREEVNIRRLGRWLAKIEGRIQNGMRIERAGITRGSQTWKVLK